MRRRRPAASPGFTLIEVVLAILILAAMLTILYESLTQMLEMKQLLDDRRDSAAIAGAVLTRMTRELQLAYAQNALMPPRSEPDKRYPPRTFMLGEEKALDNDRRGDSITFLALEGGQYLPDGGTHSGLVQITYRVERDPEKRDSPTYYLVREETPYQRPFEKAFKKTMIFPITTNLVGLKFSYFILDSGEWVSNWGSDEHVGLPAMVRFQVGIRSPAGRDDWFTTSVALRGK